MKSSAGILVSIKLFFLNSSLSVI